MKNFLNPKKIMMTALALLSIVLCAYFTYTFIYNKNDINNLENTNINMDNVDKAKKEFKIIAFGDSLTAGYGVDLKDSYPSVLENILDTSSEYKNYNTNFIVINMGVSGETSSGGVDRVNFVLSQKPDLILFSLGANDMLRGTTPSIVKNNLDYILKEIKNQNIPVILMGMQSSTSNGADYKKEFDSLYPDLAKKYNLQLVPFFLQGVALVPSLNTSDGIHPNRPGYEKIINENILPVLNAELKDTLSK